MEDAWQVKQERKRLKAEKNRKHPRKRAAKTWVAVDRSDFNRYREPFMFSGDWLSIGVKPIDIEEMHAVIM